MAQQANIDELRKILRFITKGYKVPKIIHDTIFEVAVREVEETGKVVLIKRDPDIDRNRIQAVKVKVIEGETMEIHPAVVGGFGADFDGDQMGIMAPISEEAQAEARDKMMTAVTNSSINNPIFEISKEALTGLYTITNEKMKNPPIEIKTVEEAKQLHPGRSVKFKVDGKFITTTAGRVIFNNELPDWYPFVDDSVGKKKLNEIFSKIISRDREEYARTIDRVMKLGFMMCTIYPRTISLDLLDIPDNIKNLNEDLKKEKDVVKQSAIVDKMTSMLMDYLKKNNKDLWQQIASGAAKGGDQIRQIMVSKGLVTDANGNVLPPIAKSMNEGYTPDEYFNASHGARKGVADRALATADGGYAFRKMVYVMANTECDETILDCGTRHFFEIKLTDELFKRMNGRFHMVGKKLQPVSKDFIGKIIKLRSPVFCRSDRICKRCYGELIHQIRSKHCGIIAAQECTSLSEKIMKCSDGLVHYKNHLIPFVDFMDIFEENGVVKGKDGDVSVLSIESHQPEDEMFFISTKSGHTLVCQANHPLWIKKNTLHKKYHNKTCRLIGKELYSSTGSGRSKNFEIEDKELIQIETKDLQKHDSIWVDNSIVYNRKRDIIPEIDGYVVGFYLGDGHTLGNKKETYSKGFGISQKLNDYRDYLVEKCSTVGKVLTGSDNYIVVSYKGEEKLYDKIVKGNRSWKKRLVYDFLDYNEEWLRECLAGLIDSDGTIFYNTCTTARIYTCSYYLVQQIKAICLKLGYKSFTNLVSQTGQGVGRPPNRPQFSIDIMFYEGSNLPNAQKLKTHNVKYIQRMKNDKPVKGFDVIKCVNKMSLWNYPVYDVQTETSEYMLGFVQNHNSFHLGGIVSLDVPDMLSMLIENIEDSETAIVTKSFEQKDLDLYAKADLVIMRIHENIYKDPYKIVDSDELIELPVGHFEFEVDGFTIPVTIEKKTLVHVSEKERADGIITLTYSKGDKIFTLDASKMTAQETARMIDKLVGGKSPWTTPESLFIKFFKILKQFGDWDTVHLEVILSAILRDKTDPQYPARVKHPYDPATFSIKKLPMMMSWPLGIAFENFSKSITYGLISDRAPESSIEKVLFGESLSGLDQPKSRKK